MTNKTSLLLSGLSDLPSLQLPLFFLLVYILTLTWNLLIISLVVTDSHLHTPMYFFLGNLASLDLCYSSVTVPRMLFDLLTQTRVISKAACLTQIFFFLSFATIEVLLLSIMSYDRYVAICHPLHYIEIMHWSLCIKLVIGGWFSGFIHSLVHTVFSLKLQFCQIKRIESFFCDPPLLFRISCSDTRVNILLLLFLVGFFAVVSLSMTSLSYAFIIKTVLKMQVKGSRRKVFSTCSSHITVVSLLYGTAMFNYFCPSGSSSFASDKMVSVFYSVCTPLLNPLIYSLRNQDLGKSLRRTLIFFSSSAQMSHKLGFD